MFKASFFCIACLCCTMMVSCTQKPVIESHGVYSVVTNKNGESLSFASSSGVSILEVDGFGFKDLNKNKQLDPYEDWRLSDAERAQDLASKLSLEEIAGLMLYSSHQSIPARPDGYFAGTYDGKPFENGVTNPAALSDQQKKFLKDDHLRHVLVTTVLSPEVAAEWSNNVQAFCESIGFGIPANNSSDPRHGTEAKAEYNAAAGGSISMWPSSLGMAATFDPELVRAFGLIASQEYRALGISTALSPQVDIATDPRWARFNGTFGESPQLSAAMAEAYCDGFQNSEGSENGWGSTSVNAMVKHWPGGGSGEAGRDAHYGVGKFAVYPGNNFNDHLIPFVDGAFKLKGKTGQASAVMPYYTISWNQDTVNNENVGNSYNKYIITDLLRKKYGYDGVLCTDWSITRDHGVMDVFVDGKPWGVENLSVAERHYKALMAGVDQFGGNNDKQPILDAYAMGVKEIGEKQMRARMEQSAVRLLKNIFQVGLFDHPYVDPVNTKAVVGKPDFLKKGYDAQLKSVVMLKNSKNVLPLKEKIKVFMAKRFYPASVNYMGIPSPEKEEYTIDISTLEKYFTFTDKAEEADVALVAISNPASGIGYDKNDLAKGGNGYFPISLQYGDYKADSARAVSLAGGDPLEKTNNRTYKNKTVKTSNITDADLVRNTKKLMGDKPVIVAISISNPMVFSEIESYCDAILLDFGVQHQAILDIVSGKSEPQAMLPMQMPANMVAVETQYEDVPFDMNCYKDSDGNVYDFAFGLNWKGVIKPAKSYRLN